MFYGNVTANNLANATCLPYHVSVLCAVSHIAECFNFCEGLFHAYVVSKSYFEPLKCVEKIPMNV